MKKLIIVSVFLAIIGAVIFVASMEFKPSREKLDKFADLLLNERRQFLAAQLSEKQAAVDKLQNEFNENKQKLADCQQQLDEINSATPENKNPQVIVRKKNQPDSDILNEVTDLRRQIYSHTNELSELKRQLVNTKRAQADWAAKYEETENYEEKKYDRYGNFVGTRIKTRKKYNISFFEYSKKRAEYNSAINEAERRINDISDSLPEMQKRLNIVTARAHALKLSTARLANMEAKAAAQEKIRQHVQQKKLMEQRINNQALKVRLESSVQELQSKNPRIQKVLEEEQAELEEMKSMIDAEKDGFDKKIAFIQAYAFYEALVYDNYKRIFLATCMDSNYSNFTQLRMAITAKDENVGNCILSRGFRTRYSSLLDGYQLAQRNDMVYYNNRADVDFAYNVIVKNFD